jgi:hypothetical protein
LSPRQLRWSNTHLSTLFLVRLLSRFDLHVLEFTGLEDLAALPALNIFGLFVARYDLHLRMLAWFGTHFFLGWLRGMARRHKLRGLDVFEKGSVFIEIGRILRPPVQKVKSPGGQHLSGNSSRPKLIFPPKPVVFSPETDRKPFNQRNLLFNREFQPLPARACHKAWARVRIKATETVVVLSDLISRICRAETNQKSGLRAHGNEALGGAP